MRQACESGDSEKTRQRKKQHVYLTDDQRAEIASRYELGDFPSAIAASFGISPQRVNNIAREAKLPPRKRASITGTQIYELLKAQGFRCALSNRPLTMDHTHADHKIPCSRGGDETIENIQMLHSEVNRLKGTYTTEEFVAICCEVARHSGGMT